MKLPWRKNAHLLLFGSGIFALAGAGILWMIDAPDAAIVGLLVVPVTGMANAATKLLDPEPAPEPTPLPMVPLQAFMAVADKVPSLRLEEADAVVLDDQDTDE